MMSCLLNNYFIYTPDCDGDVRYLQHEHEEESEGRYDEVELQLPRAVIVTDPLTGRAVSGRRRMRRSEVDGELLSYTQTSLKRPLQMMYIRVTF